MEIFLLLQIMTIFSNQKILYQITKKKTAYIFSLLYIARLLNQGTGKYCTLFFNIHAYSFKTEKRKNTIWFRIVCRHSAFLSLGLTCPHVWLSIRNSRIQYLHRLVVRWAMEYEIIRTGEQHARNIDRHYILTHDDKMYDSDMISRELFVISGRRQSFG